MGVGPTRNVYSGYHRYQQWDQGVKIFTTKVLATFPARASRSLHVRCTAMTSLTCSRWRLVNAIIVLAMVRWPA